MSLLGKTFLLSLKFAWLLTLCLISFSCTQKSLKPTTKSALFFYYRAENNLKQNDFESALANLDSAIIYNPQLANFYRVKGFVLEKLERPVDAIAVYEKGLEHYPSQPEIQGKLGNLYLSVGDFANAAVHLKKASHAYPDSAAIHFQLGKAFYQMGDFAFALNQFSAYQSLITMPDSMFWKWEGLARFKAKNYPAAAAALEKYLTPGSNDVEAIKILGFAKFNIGDYDEAISYLNRVEAFFKNDVEMYRYRAKYFLIYGKPDIAYEQLSNAIVIDSTNSDVWFELGEVDYHSGRYEQSRRRLNKVLLLDQEYWPAYRYLGFLAEKEHELEKAEAYYKKYLEHTFERDAEVVERMEGIASKLRVK